jgi:hypothetical protein
LLGAGEVLPSALIDARVFICDQAESFSPSKFLHRQFPPSFVAARLSRICYACLRDIRRRVQYL